MNAIPDLTGGVRKMQAAGGRRDLRRSLEARLKVWQALIVSSFFIVMIGATLFLGVVMMVGTIRGKDSSNELTANGRTGRIAQALRGGTLCRYMVFDNKTAQTVEDRIGRCDEGKPKPKKETPPIFVWGGR
jgi:hypothetical protein